MNKIAHILGVKLKLLLNKNKNKNNKYQICLHKIRVLYLGQVIIANSIEIHKMVRILSINSSPTKMSKIY